MLVFRPTRASGTRRTSSNDAQHCQDLLWRGFGPPPLPIHHKYATSSSLATFRPASPLTIQSQPRNLPPYATSSSLTTFIPFSPLTMQSQPRNLPPYHLPTFPGPKPRVLTQKPHSARKSLRRMLIFPYRRRLPSVNVACARFRLYARARELKNLWPTWVSEAENKALKARASTLIVHYTQQLSRASASLAATVVAQQASITSMLQDPPSCPPSVISHIIHRLYFPHSLAPDIRWTL